MPAVKFKPPPRTSSKNQLIEDDEEEAEQLGHFDMQILSVSNIAFGSICMCLQIADLIRYCDSTERSLSLLAVTYVLWTGLLTATTGAFGLIFSNTPTQSLSNGTVTLSVLCIPATGFSTIFRAFRLMESYYCQDVAEQGVILSESFEGDLVHFSCNVLAFFCNMVLILSAPEDCFVYQLQSMNQSPATPRRKDTSHPHMTANVTASRIVFWTSIIFGVILLWPFKYSKIWALPLER